MVLGTTVAVVSTIITVLSLTVRTFELDLGILKSAVSTLNIPGSCALLSSINSKGRFHSTHFSDLFWGEHSSSCFGFEDWGSLLLRSSTKAMFWQASKHQHSNFLHKASVLQSNCSSQHESHAEVNVSHCSSQHESDTDANVKVFPLLVNMPLTAVSNSWLKNTSTETFRHFQHPRSIQSSRFSLCSLLCLLFQSSTAVEKQENKDTHDTLWIQNAFLNCRMWTNSQPGCKMWF